MNPTSACPVCGGRSHDWATVPDHHYQNPGTWPIDECTSCGARFLDPMPTPEALGAFYPTEYYSHQVQPANGTSLKSRVRASVLPLGTGEPDFAAAGRMVDVGSGSGWMLERYRDKGWTTEGVEYSAAACTAGRSNGLTMHCGSLHDAALPGESFDYVRSNHSFEHLTNPVETIDEMFRILKPGGTLFIGVPDTLGLTARVFGPDWFYVGAPVHTINYNRENLPALLRRRGFEIVNVRANSNHCGVIGSLQCKIGGLLRRRVNLSRGPVTWAPLILVGYWVARLIDLLRLGDCVEVIAVKPRDGSR